MRSHLLQLELSELPSTIRTLLRLAFVDPTDDALIREQAYYSVAESTPAPRPIVSSLQQLYGYVTQVAS
ncbi:hypothetical protein QBC34DRAFT_383369 [Podospora aff. communis PSN243]|uniref:Uncharacterized protein n=1 Tax=Podospora aff. communis PSN243 TaxID=3040156 RepID=A0AAV9GCK9_9PEZI|nr:hypothetical protein QBC34DRAFT_383369 [Podospora aff. communis PSN243]